MKDDGNICKAKIDYPCQWLYKVIGSDQEQLKKAIKDTIENTPCRVQFSNSSSSGKYLCLNLELEVQSEAERNEIFMELKAHPHVKIVL